MGKGVSDLNHTIIDSEKGRKIIVLDTGAILGAEAVAMLQALHSRSTGGLESHLEVLKKRGAERFMENFYVGYGHKSIGDCGTTTAFVEGVSMLAAKAIQDSPLYNGQEASTRYIDFSEQPIIDPTNSSEGKKLMEMQRNFYLDSLVPIKRRLRSLHPRQNGEDERVYEKAINARAFDIARGFLPAGVATNLAWHTNLRQASDRILFLRHHPLPEVREIASELEEGLRKAHPSSFGHKRYSETEEYQDLIAENYFYHDADSPLNPKLDFSRVDFKELSEFEELLSRRPKKTEIPKFIGQTGILGAKFTLDYGSFRDIQRHRAVSQRMPLLTRELGFNEWYLENLPDETKNSLENHLEEIDRRIRNLDVSRETEQYFTPMGYNTSNKITGELPGVVYLVELRDSRFVHPTLQRVAHSIGQQVSAELNIPIHVDPEPNRFDVKRGEQDIIIKND